MDELFDLVDLILSPGIFMLIMLFVAYRFVKRAMSGVNEAKKKFEQAQQAQQRRRRQDMPASEQSTRGESRSEKIFELLQDRLEEASAGRSLNKRGPASPVREHVNADSDLQLLSPQEERRMSGESTSLISGTSSSQLLGGNYAMPTMKGLAPIGTGAIAGGSIMGTQTGGSITGGPAGGSALDATGGYDFHMAGQMATLTVDAYDVPPVEVAPIAPTLRDPAELRRAFVLKEILDKPRAMRR